LGRRLRLLEGSDEQDTTAGEKNRQESSSSKKARQVDFCGIIFLTRNRLCLAVDGFESLCSIIGIEQVVCCVLFIIILIAPQNPLRYFILHDSFMSTILADEGIVQNLPTWTPKSPHFAWDKKM